MIKYIQKIVFKKPRPHTTKQQLYFMWTLWPTDVKKTTSPINEDGHTFHLWEKGFCKHVTCTKIFLLLKTDLYVRCLPQISTALPTDQLFLFFCFFFCGTFHNIFKLGTPYLFLHRYQWKKLPKPPWGGFGKNHCKEYLIGYWEV